MANYSATTSSFTIASSPTDIVTISGSSTKTVRILSIEINTTQTALGLNQWSILKRSGTNSGGTSSSLTAIGDSQEVAASSSLLQYTVNPSSLGTLIGTIKQAYVLAPTLATSLLTTSYIFDFAKPSADHGVILNGTSELLVLNFAGAAKPLGLSLTATIIWQEY